MSVTQTTARDLDLETRCHLRDEPRNARADALGDAEDFNNVLVAIERLGGAISAH